MIKHDKRKASVLTPEEVEDYRRWWEERHPEQAEADKARKLDIVRREWQD
jgi:type IV secretory pathway VirJ component